jgi:hypothetical protein
MSIDLKHLRSADAAARHGSFRKAAALKAEARRRVEASGNKRDPLPSDIPLPRISQRFRHSFLGHSLAARGD